MFGVSIDSVGLARKYNLLHHPITDVLTSEEPEPSFQMDSIPGPLWNKKLARTLSEQLADKAGRSRSCGSPWETEDNYEVQVSTSRAVS